MTIVGTPSTERRGRRLPRFLLAVGVLLTAVSVTIAGPGEAGAQVAVLPVAIAVAEDAAAVGGSVLGVGLAPALVAIGAATASFYLYSAWADGTGPFASGGLIDQLTGKASNGRSSGDGEYATSSSIPSFPDGVGNDTVYWENSCKPGRGGDFCGNYAPGLAGIGDHSTCLVTSGSNPNTIYDVEYNGPSGLQTPCTRTAGDQLIYSRSDTAGSQYFAVTIGYALNPHHPETIKNLVITATKHCNDPTKTPPNFDVMSTGHGVTQLPNVACPNGSTPTGEDFSIDLPNGTLALGGITNGTAAAYPLCAAGCAHSIKVDGVTCTVGAQLCYSWGSLDPARVECSFGTYVVGLAECESIKYGYRSTGGLGQDQTSNSTELVPLRKETGLPDPKYGPGTTWAPAPAPTTAPAPQPSGSATPTPTPTGTGAPAPNPSATPSPTTVPAPGGAGAPGPGATPDESDCFPSGWGLFNPVEWVLKPVKCALMWAFVPPSGTLTSSVQGVRDTLASKPPYSLIAPVAAPLVALGHSYGGGCGGSLANFGGGLVIPCSPGGAGWAVTLYVIASGAIVFATAFALWSMLETALHKE